MSETRTLIKDIISRHSWHDSLCLSSLRNALDTKTIALHKEKLYCTLSELTKGFLLTLIILLSLIRRLDMQKHDMVEKHLKIDSSLKQNEIYRLSCLKVVKLGSLLLILERH